MGILNEYRVAGPGFLVAVAVLLVGCTAPAPAVVAGAEAAIGSPDSTLRGTLGLQTQRLCNGVFVTGLTPDRYEAILAKFNTSGRVQDLYPAATWKTSVDPGRKSVTITGEGGGLSGTVRQTTKLVTGYGCIPLGSDDAVHFTTTAAPKRELAAVAVASTTPWPVGDQALTHVWKNTAGAQAIDADVEKMFANDGQFGFTLSCRGELIYEHYAPGITPDTAVDGYSLSKSATATLIGALIQKGWLQLSSPGGLPQWRTAGDPRGKVTVDNLLRMESGLDFPTTAADGSAGFAGYWVNALAAAEIPGSVVERLDRLAVRTAPGGQSVYLNANYELLSARAAEVLEEHGYSSVADGFYNLVFDKLGMRTAEFRSDTQGHLAGSRHITASARDWAKLGQLYVQDGVWNGQRILPENWRSYVTTSSGPSAGTVQNYGAGFWLNLVGNDATQANMTNQPSDAFFAVGSTYQFVSMWPKDEVVMTLTSDGADSKIDLATYEHLSGVVLDLARKNTLG